MASLNGRVHFLAVSLLLVTACVILGNAAASQGAWVLVVLAGVAALGAAMRWPLRVVVGLILYMPFEGLLLKLVPSGVSGVLSAAPEALLFVCAVSAIVQLGDRGLDGVAVMTWVAWLGAFIAWGLVSGYVGNVPWLDAVYWLRTVVRYMPAALVVGVLVGRREFTSLVAPAFSAGIVVQAVICVAEFIGGPAVRTFFLPGTAVVGGLKFVDYSAMTRVTQVAGTLGFYNNFALYAAMCFAISIGALRAWSPTDADSSASSAFRYWVLRSGVVASIVCILLAGSRQGIIVFLVLVFAMVFLVGLEGIGGRAMLVSMIGVALVMTALLSPDIAGPLAWLPERFSSVFNMEYANQSIQVDRLFAVVRVAPAVMVLSPVLGVGPGALNTAAGIATVARAVNLNPAFVLFVQDVGWVGLFVQLGLGGLVLVLWLGAWLWTRARNGMHAGWLHRGEAAAVIGCIVVASLGLFASSILLMRMTSLAMWCVAGLCLRRHFVGAAESGPSERDDA